jgi:hypothetical protein
VDIESYGMWLMRNGTERNRRVKYATHLPVLSDVEGPFELEVGLFVIIYEGGDSSIVAAGEHAGGGIFLSNYCVMKLVLCEMWGKLGE